MKTLQDVDDSRATDDDMVTISRAEWDHIRTAGYAVIPNWLLRDPNVSDLMIRVYGNVASHCGAGGTWEMSHSTIGEEVGKSPSSVRRALVELRNLGVVDWTTPPPQQPGERARGCRYRVKHHPGTPPSTPSSPVTYPPVQEGPPVHQRTTPLFTGELPPCSPVSYKEEPLEQPLEQPLLTASLSLVSACDVPTPPDRFEEFWQAYPRKTGKGAARKAWSAAVKKAPPALVIAALVEQRSTLAMQNRPDGDFRPHPASWLNAERWTDEPEVPAASDQAWKVSAPAPDFGPVCGECERPAGRHFTKCSRWAAGA